MDRRKVDPCRQNDQRDEREGDDSDIYLPSSSVLELSSVSRTGGWSHYYAVDERTCSHKPPTPSFSAEHSEILKHHRGEYFRIRSLSLEGRIPRSPLAGDSLSAHGWHQNFPHR